MREHETTFSRAQEGRVRQLTAVSLSLWRAVFLARYSSADKIVHAKTFLEKMIEENAITFASDLNNNSWSFNYYIDNARHRLLELGDSYPEVKNALALEAGDLSTAKNRWERCQRAFSHAVNAFAQEF